MGAIFMKYMVFPRFSAFLTPAWGNSKAEEKSVAERQFGTCNGDSSIS